MKVLEVWSRSQIRPEGERVGVSLASGVMSAAGGKHHHPSDAVAQVKLRQEALGRELVLTDPSAFLRRESIRGSRASEGPEGGDRRSGCRSRKKNLDLFGVRNQKNGFRARLPDPEGPMRIYHQSRDVDRLSLNVS